MTTKNKVIVPDHVAKQVEEQNKQTGEKLEKAYIPEESRVLDPTLLDKSIIERMPQPTGWRLLILPFQGLGVSKGGIILTQSHVDRESLATVCAYVVKTGPLCYKDKRFSGVLLDLNLQVVQTKDFLERAGVVKNNGY